MKKRLYVDFHVLQTVPPSCINRDDTGSPKTAIYGGVTRARVSSQAWKHAMRQAFVEESLLDEEDVGKRTKKVTELVEKEIAALAPEKDAAKLAKKTLDNAGIKNDEKGTKALFFISQAQIKVLAQLAHSISTHAVQNEYDYFTAVDDCQVEDNAGAGHLGTVEYNSATLYRYATVNVMELERHLGAKKAAEVVRSFGEAFIRSMPTGKQNTFANRTLPDAVYVTIREDQPVNLCGAFERAVRKSAEGYAEPSKSALQAYAQQLYQSFAEAPAKSFTVGTGLEALAPAQPLNTMLDALEEAVKENLTGNEVE